MRRAAVRRALRTLSVLCVLSGGVFTGACGYALAGRGSALPASVRTIGIPMFTNRTSVFNLETTLTTKVRAEFIGRTKYQIVPTASGVDSVLTGEVTSVSIVPSAFNSQQLASRYAITMSARVELRNTKDDMVLWENPALIFRQEFDATGSQSGQGAVDPTIFFGQDTNALDRMSGEFARSIVSAILEAF
jgi:hypothetical protein